jgi:hypothetical protein
MMNKKELESLLRDLRSELDLSKVKVGIAILKEEHEILLKNLDDLERVLEQATSIIQRIRRISTTRSRQLHYSLRGEILPKEEKMPEIVEER